MDSQDLPKTTMNKLLNDQDAKYMMAKKEQVKQTLVNLEKYLEKLKTYIHKKYIEPANANQNADNDSQCHNGVRAV